MWRRLARVLKWTAAAAVLGVAALAAPVAYVEAFCTADPVPQEFTPLITDPGWQRSEAATYLTYPEWHIVYAYEELARVLQESDEHRFGYAESVAGFWSSYCSLNRLAQAHGGGDFETRTMVYVIGTSFTVEMGFKAAYEHTLGRLAAALRGPVKTAQDELAAEMATRYGRFLHQTPWYMYPFAEERDRLWALSADSFRGWERRLALGAEWSAKQAYAGLIAAAVEASGEAMTEIRTAVSGLSPQELDSLEDVQVLRQEAGYAVIQAPRYRAFTHILQEVAERGGTVEDIAGNDDVLVSYVFPEGSSPAATGGGTVLADLPRQGFGDRRALVSLKVFHLSGLLREIEEADGHRLEHVFDY
jgi:hypothetical protein